MNIKTLNARFKVGIRLVPTFVLVLILVSWINKDEISKPFQKKISKTTSELWNEEITLANTDIQENQKVSLEKFGAQSVFDLYQENQKVGYLILAKARSKFEDFDYAIYYDLSKNIKAVRVLQYREDYGGEIGSKRWLRQFEDKNSQSAIQIGEDIQGISGATISYLAITKGVKNLTNIFSEIK